MDGQPSLWEASDACLEDFLGQRETAGESPVVDILDIIHVAGYVWKAAKAFYGHKEHQEAFAQDRLLRILRGEVAGVVKGLRRMASERRPARAGVEGRADGVQLLREQRRSACGTTSTCGRAIRLRAA